MCVISTQEPLVECVMQVLGKKWEDGYLDYSIHSDNDVAIDVEAWWNVKKITDQYFQYKPDWRVLGNYILEIGIFSTLRKVLSRRKERERNQKFVSVGIGVVSTAACAVKSLSLGDRVIFFAYNHPRCVSRVVLPEVWVQRWEYTCDFLHPANIRYFEEPSFILPKELLDHQAWSPFAGIVADRKEIQVALRELAVDVNRSQLADSEEMSRLRFMTLDKKVSFDFEVASSANRSSPVTAALFGYGNYAKTALLPFLNRRIEILRIHEIDPMQLGRVKRRPSVALDTSAEPRAEQSYDAYFIAGFHHTHAALAVHALEKNAYAVVEKPIATTRDQLINLRSAIEENSSKFIACFHKRYSPLNRLARVDLGASDEPVNYHCIVFEMPLPAKHWYNWPSSGSRIISNGCHWIDHFMFFNGFASVSTSTVVEHRNGDVFITIELENDASFAMTLTDRGSSRLGVRDHIELRANGVTVQIEDGSRYRAESRSRVLRRSRENRVKSYGNMYREISRRIIARDEGDPVISLRSSELVVDLEERFQCSRSDSR